MNPQVRYPITVYYDGSCPMCNSEMHNLMARNAAGRLVFVDCSPAEFSGGPAPRETLMTAMHTQDADGRVFTGIGSFRVCYAAVGLPAVSFVLGLPVIGALLERGYPVLARNRYRLPRGLVSALFDRAAHRAARRAARRSAACAAGQCAVAPTPNESNS